MLGSICGDFPEFQQQVKYNYTVTIKGVISHHHLSHKRLKLGNYDLLILLKELIECLKFVCYLNKHHFCHRNVTNKYDQNEKTNQEGEGIKDVGYDIQLEFPHYCIICATWTCYFIFCDHLNHNDGSNWLVKCCKA